MRNVKKQKLELCKNYALTKYCKWGENCWFAHEAHELHARALPSNYKTVLCKTYQRFGFCKYGDRCHYIHKVSEEQTIWRSYTTKKSSGRLRVFEQLSEGQACF